MYVYVFFFCIFFLMIRLPPRSTQSRSSAASDVYKRQGIPFRGNVAENEAVVVNAKPVPRPRMAVPHHADAMFAATGHPDGDGDDVRLGSIEHDRREKPFSRTLGGHAVDGDGFIRGRGAPDGYFQTGLRRLAMAVVQHGAVERFVNPEHQRFSLFTGQGASRSRHWAGAHAILHQRAPQDPLRDRPAGARSHAPRTVSPRPQEP